MQPFLTWRIQVWIPNFAYILRKNGSKLCDFLWGTFLVRSSMELISFWLQVWCFISIPLLKLQMQPQFLLSEDLHFLLGTFIEWETYLLFNIKIVLDIMIFTNSISFIVINLPSIWCMNMVLTKLRSFIHNYHVPLFFHVTKLVPNFSPIFFSTKLWYGRHFVVFIPLANKFIVYWLEFEVFVLNQNQVSLPSWRSVQRRTLLSISKKTSSSLIWSCHNFRPYWRKKRLS